MSKVNDLQVNGQLLSTNKVKNGFTQISNAVLLDERLSFKARGILSLLLSRPDNWRIYLREIVTRSNKDGLKAIQSGFKELVALGYIQLETFLNDKTGHFEGKGYAICKQSNTHRQSPFGSVLKTDRPKIGQTSKRKDLKSDLPKTAYYSNTNCSNTKKINTKKQQQQKEATHKSDDVVFENLKKDIRYFSPTLLKDTSWQTLYTSSSSDVKKQFSIDEIYLLILHFKNTSLKSGSTYVDISQVKKHFANWFQANLTKKTLLKYIQEGKRNERQAKAILLPLISKINACFDTLLQRQCKEIKQVLEFQEQLIEAKEKLISKQILLSNSEERESLNILQSDITKMLSKLKKGAAKDQLAWFCQATFSLAD